MFCSDACMEDATIFHASVCNEIGEIKITTDFTQIASRAVYEVISMFGTVSKLKKFLESNAGSKTVFDFNLSSVEDLQQEKQLVQAANSLWWEYSTKEIDAGLESVIKELTQATSSVSQEQQSFMSDFIKKQLNIILTNFTLLKQLGSRSSYGLAVFLVSSLIDQSCEPNVEIINVEDRSVIVVTRSIKKGRQLFSQNKTVSIKNNEFFEKPSCGCLNCTEVYRPADSSIRVATTKPESFQLAVLELLENFIKINRVEKFDYKYEVRELTKRNSYLMSGISQPDVFFFNSKDVGKHLSKKYYERIVKVLGSNFSACIRPQE